MTLPVQTQNVDNVIYADQVLVEGSEDFTQYFTNGYKYYFYIPTFLSGMGLSAQSGQMTSTRSSSRKPTDMSLLVQGTGGAAEGIISNTFTITHPC